MRKIVINKKKKETKKNITFRLDIERITDIREIARNNNISMVAVVEHAIEKLKEYLESDDQ